MGSCESETTDVAFKMTDTDLYRSASEDSVYPVDVAVQNSLAEQNGGNGCWTSVLCTTEFFQPCSMHASLKKNECNYFCSTCPERAALCRHCVQEHQCSSSEGIFFQIRRYMYRYVVHLDDLNQYFDSAGIQSYCINQRKAVLLNPKDSSSNISAAPVFDNQCDTCKVPLRPDCQYCCLDCKATAYSGLIAPQTPMSLTKSKRQLEPRIVRKHMNSFFQEESTRDVVVKSSLRKSSAGRVKKQRLPHRARKLLVPQRSVFE